MLDAQRVTLVGKAGGEPAQNVGLVLNLVQQQSTAIADDVTAVKAAHHFTFANVCKRK
jgi:hypothetical protein